MKTKSDQKERYRRRNFFLKKNTHVALVQKLKAQLLNLSAILLAIFVIKITSFGCCFICDTRDLQDASWPPKKGCGCTPPPVCACSNWFSKQDYFFNEYACTVFRILGCCFEKYDSFDWLPSPFFKGPYLAQYLISGRGLSFAKQYCALPWREMLVRSTFFFYFV